MAKWSVNERIMDYNYPYDIVSEVFYTGSKYVEMTVYRHPEYPDEYGSELYYLNTNQLKDGHYYSRNYKHFNNVPQQYKHKLTELRKIHQKRFGINYEEAI
ncbi:MAG: hypothetical protein ACOC2W_02455 [bacterium]